MSASPAAAAGAAEEALTTSRSPSVIRSPEALAEAAVSGISTVTATPAVATFPSKRWRTT